MPVVPFTKPTASDARMPDTRGIDPTMFVMAAAELHEADRLIEPLGPPMDITSQAQKADRQKTSNTWPEGTDPSVKKIFNDRLKSGDITREQYNKAMRDPRQFQADQ